MLNVMILYLFSNVSELFWLLTYFVMRTDLLACLLKGFICFYSYSMNSLVQISVCIRPIFKDEINSSPVDFSLEGVTLASYKMWCCKCVEIRV